MKANAVNRQKKQGISAERVLSFGEEVSPFKMIRTVFGAFLFLASCSYCASYIGPLEFKGVVTNKYLDKSYKNTPRIIVNSGKEIMITPAATDTNLYQHLNVGDSLIKNKGSLDFKVIHHGESKWYTMKCD